MTRKKRTCSICQRPLTWWNAQSCMKCGQTICRKHAHTIRRPRSSVLFSLCTNCALSLAKRRAINPHSQPGVSSTNAGPNSIWSSLSGISFSGISFSGISFSGLKKKQQEGDEQPDPTQKSQQEPNDPPRSEPITPLPDVLANEQKEPNDPPSPNTSATPPDKPDEDEGLANA